MGIRLGVAKLQWIHRHGFRIKFFKFTVIEEHRQSFASADAEVVTTMRANLLRFFEVARVEVRLAAVALYEHVFSLDYAFFGRNGFNLLVFLAEPGHREDLRCW